MPSPAPASKSPSEVREKISWIWSFWKPHRGFLVFLVFFTLVSSAVAVGYPMVLMVVLDKLNQAAPAAGGETGEPTGQAGGGTAGGTIDETPGEPASGTAGGTAAGDAAGAAGTGGLVGTLSQETVRQVLLILAALALGRLIAGFYPCFRAWMNNKIDVAVREKVFGHILRKDHRFFGRFSTGDLTTRLMDDIAEYPKIAWFSCSGIFRAVDSGSRLLFCVGAMFFIDRGLAALSLVPLPFMMYVVYRVRSRLSEAGENQQRAISATNDMLEKTFSGIRIVKAFTAERGQTAALDRLLEHRIGVTYRLQRLWATLTTFDTAAARLGQLVVVAAGGVMVARGQVTLGSLYALYTYLDMLVQPMWDLPNLLVTARQTFVCIDREEEVMRFPEGRSYPDEGPAPGPLASLEFERVGFAYAEGRPVLQQVSFRVESGQTLAIVGPVAAGKSTVLRLACGLLVPDSGSVRFNGIPLEDYGAAEFRRRIGFAPQDSLLFSESIRENVTMGRSIGRRAQDDPRPQPLRGNHGEPADPRNPDVAGDLTEAADEAWVQRVLRAAQMDAELSRMPEGTGTVLGQKGSKISGGQRQRVSIARALYDHPEILLLDDCTSSLDADNEDRLWEEIRRLRPDAAVLLVSHRLATIRRADRILVLDAGRSVDLGTHEELSDRCEVYRTFLQQASERERASESAAVPGA